MNTAIIQNDQKEEDKVTQAQPSNGVQIPQVPREQAVYYMDLDGARVYLNEEGLAALQHMGGAPAEVHAISAEETAGEGVAEDS